MERNRRKVVALAVGRKKRRREHYYNNYYYYYCYNSFWFFRKWWVWDKWKDFYYFIVICYLIIVSIFSVDVKACPSCNIGNYCTRVLDLKTLEWMDKILNNPFESNYPQRIKDDGLSWRSWRWLAIWTLKLVMKCRNGRFWTRSWYFTLIKHILFEEERNTSRTLLFSFYGNIITLKNILKSTCNPQNMICNSSNNT